MICLDDPSELVVQGPFLSQNEINVVIKITKCTDKDICNSDPNAIDQFIESHFVTILRNHQKYDPQSYGEETIKNDIYEEWLPLDPKRGLAIISLQ